MKAYLVKSCPFLNSTVAREFIKNVFGEIPEIVLQMDSFPMHL